MHIGKKCHIHVEVDLNMTCVCSTLCAEEPRIEVNNSLGQVDIVYLNCDVCHYFKVIV